MMDFILSPLISDGMIIQRNSPFPIWSKKKININFLGKIYEAVPDNDKWLITLDPLDLKAGGPFEMEISSKDESAFKIQDIYAGDLWLCAGQSNMEMQMSRLCDDYGEEWEQVTGNKEQVAGNKEQLCFPLIRQFNVPQEWDFVGPREDYTGGNWMGSSKENLHEFAAVPWFFARNLYEKHKVPIGLIVTPWGGTPVESWMSEEALSEYPQKIAEAKQYANKTKRDEVINKNSTEINEWETDLAHEDIGIAEQWEKQETDISDWKDITLPGDFYEASQKDSELNKFCGVIWLAKDFDTTQSFAGTSSAASRGKNAKVWLGTIIDSDKVYINGTEIGSTGYRYPPRKYIANELIKNGKNRIVIRVVCNCGDGGITTDKPFRIFTDNESIELSGTWKYKISAKTKERPQEFFPQWLPIGDYNAMIAPILKYPLKGVIWYQGESNESAPYEYEKLFETMINDWRIKNKNETLPFLFVQLPIFGELSDNNEEHRWAILREAQKNALSLPATGMAAALELGEWNDIHPINKKDIGYRLFLAAEKTVYGAENTSPGPLVQSCDFKQDKIKIKFNNIGDGLVIKDNQSNCSCGSCGTSLCTRSVLLDSIGKVWRTITVNEKKYSASALARAVRPASWLNSYVTVIGSEGQFRLPVTINQKNCVIIDISTVKNPQKILYAWADNPRDSLLFNSDGLPVIPFRINLKGENDV